MRDEEHAHRDGEPAADDRHLGERMDSDDRALGPEQHHHLVEPPACIDHAEQRHQIGGNERDRRQRLRRLGLHDRRWSWHGRCRGRCCRARHDLPDGGDDRLGFFLRHARAALGRLDAQVAQLREVVLGDHAQRPEPRHRDQPGAVEIERLAVEEQQHGEHAEDQHAERPAEDPE